MSPLECSHAYQDLNEAFGTEVRRYVGPCSDLSVRATTAGLSAHDRMVPSSGQQVKLHPRYCETGWAQPQQNTELGKLRANDGIQDGQTVCRNLVTILLAVSCGVRHVPIFGALY